MPELNKLRNQFRRFYIILLEHRTSAKTDLIRPHFAESLVISEEFIQNSGLNSAKFMQTAICVMQSNQKKVKYAKNIKYARGVSGLGSLQKWRSRFQMHHLQYALQTEL